MEAFRPRAVFHLGAITDTTGSDEREMVEANVSGFSRLMDACAWAGVQLVYASSAATYGSPPQAHDRVPFPLAAAGHPNNVYGFSKWLMECEHRRFAARCAEDEGPPPIVGLRYFNVFGPGESRKGPMASMVYQLAARMLRGQPPRVFRSGEQARDQVYVDDAVECTLRAAGLGAGPAPVPGVYNVGSGMATTFNEVIAAIREAIGASERELPTEYFEMPAEVRRFYQGYTCADLSETERGLGWRPRCSPREAIAAFARRLRDERGGAG